ncbi:MAG: Uma2 family endonuclease [Chloroflexi bacterium]|nr:Uma2 family endonuclease [Chloroflexota bacterium]
MVARTTAAFPTPPVAKAERTTPARGEWTYEDYLRLPDDGRRYEIIEGVLYVTNAPSYDHQFTVGELQSELRAFVKARGLGVVLTAPFEVHLPGIARPVQPDVLFIAAERQPHPGASFYEGAPDLIVEVLSPGSLRLDQAVKLSAYERAGVREYWLADPKTRSITTYTLPAGGQEYLLLGQFAAGEHLRSNVLPGLELAVEGLFLPPAG